MSVDPADVCAIIVTTGDNERDIARIVEDLPYGEVLVRYPEKTVKYSDDGVYVCAIHADKKIYGRYLAISLTDKPYIYFQDDDIVFTRHEELLAEFVPGKLLSNMGREWIEAQSYYDVALVGLGSLVERDLPARVLARYTVEYPYDERFDIDADFAFGTLAPWKRVDLGAEVLPTALDPSRLSMQPGQMEGKWETIRKARALRTVCLTMIVKNEQENIIRALDSATGLYDSVLLIDTGSTDKTLATAGHWLADRDIPHRLYEKPWVDFGTNRNELLALGREMGDFMLLMDADEEFVEVPVGGWEHLLADAYFLHYAGSIDYAQPRLLFNNFPWYFDGRVHAALDADQPAACFDLREPKIVHHGDVRHGTTKMERDIELLTCEIEDGHEVPRNTFLRAKAYEGVGQRDKAIADYEDRIAMSIGDEESYYSRFRLGCLLVEHKNLFLEGLDQLVTAWTERPGRVESLRAAAQYITAVADATPYPKDDKVIVHRMLYTETD